MNRYHLSIISLVLALSVLSTAYLVEFVEPLGQVESIELEEKIEVPTRYIVINGLVEAPFNLTLGEMVKMPKTVVTAELICVDFPSFPVSYGNWTGVTLKLILDKAGILPEAQKIAFYALDGYSTDLTISDAMNENVIIAYEKDSVPLPEELRLVVPGKWGYKWIAYITHIELVDFDYKGQCESRGYPDSADIP